MLDEKLPFADDPRSAEMRLTTFAPGGELLVIGSFSGGNSSSSTRNAGQRFDEFELFTTNNATVNPTDIFIARLAANYAPAAPLLALVTPLSITGLLQDSLTLEGRASGVPSPGYQWLLNGQPIAGATNRVLTFGSLQRTNRGNYSLVASNAVGVTTSPAIALTPQLRTNMTGWTLATSSTNYLGEPVKIGADDAGNSYLLLLAASFELRKYDRNGNYIWRFNESPDTLTGYILNAFSPVVAPSGEVFVSGRWRARSSNNSVTENNFLARLNPLDGTMLWMKNLGNVGTGQSDQAAIRETDLNAPGKIRVLLSDKTVRTFAFDGTESPKVTLSFLPAVLNQAYARYALDANGGVYFYANRYEALNLGGTNFTALSNAGMQSYVLARYDAGGTFLWSRAFPGPGGIALTPVLNVDAQGNLLIAGELSFNFGQTLQVGTNFLSGYGYVAKVTPVGEVAWAKAWWLHVEDAAVRADGSLYLDGWFRYELINNGSTTNAIHFGTNLVRGSSITSHDFFVARVDASGNEQFIRQTGSPDFSTEDNARAYNLAVDSRGVVTTAGYTRAAQTGAGLDFGDLRYEWPNLLPYGHNGNPSKCYFIARLEVDASPAPPSAPQLAFTLPAPGAMSIKLSWPDGFQLQRFVPSTPGVWETLAVPSPYDASVTQFKQAYFRVIKAP